MDFRNSGRVTILLEDRGPKLGGEPLILVCGYRVWCNYVLNSQLPRPKLMGRRGGRHPNGDARSERFMPCPANEPYKPELVHASPEKVQVRHERPHKARGGHAGPNGVTLGLTGTMSVLKRSIRVLRGAMLYPIIGPSCRTGVSLNLA